MASASGRGGNCDTKTRWRVPDLLAIKAAGGEMTQEQIQQFVEGVTDGSVDQTQLGAFLMAVFMAGMTMVETVALTTAMKNSGSLLEWPQDWVVGDKHSTGGVGDKVSIPLTPALAACGLKVPMISGRGLAHTGGTLDKLESIPGMNVSLPEEDLQKALEEVGCAITGQTKDIVPADKRMYATRDVTATVASTPLIVSSILSKKAAESLSCLVLDVKCGEASFTKTLPDAEGLATALVDTMTAMGVTTTALITAMDYPIGRTIGNALEVKEALECLSGRGPLDLQELVIGLGGELLHSAVISSSIEDGQERIRAALKSGAAMAAFQKMLVAQGVDKSVAFRLCQEDAAQDILPLAPHTTTVTAHTTGTIAGQKALVLAEVSLSLGAGRNKPGEPILYDVGIVLDKVVGEQVNEGEVWATIHHKEPCLSKELLTKARGALKIDPSTKPFQGQSRVLKKIAYKQT